MSYRSAVAVRIPGIEHNDQLASTVRKHLADYPMQRVHNQFGTTYEVKEYTFTDGMVELFDALPASYHEGFEAGHQGEDERDTEYVFERFGALWQWVTDSPVGVTLLYGTPTVAQSELVTGPVGEAISQAAQRVSTNAEHIVEATLRLQEPQALPMLASDLDALLRADES